MQPSHVFSPGQFRCFWQRGSSSSVGSYMLQPNNFHDQPCCVLHLPTGLRGLTYEERLQALKLQPLEKRRLRNDLVLTHKMLYNLIDLDATQLFKFSRRPGLRRSSIRLLHQTGRTHRSRTTAFDKGEAVHQWVPICCNRKISSLCVNILPSQKPVQAGCWNW